MRERMRIQVPEMVATAAFAAGLEAAARVIRLRGRSHGRDDRYDGQGAYGAIDPETTAKAVLAILPARYDGAAWE